jgi:predicted peroxiredoxin
MKKGNLLQKVAATVGFVAVGMVIGGLLGTAPQGVIVDPAYAEATQAEAKEVVVHLSHSTDDLHAASMALKLARVIRSKGASVHLFVDLEGARVADKRVPGSLRWGPGDATLGQLYDALIEAGGKVLVCPHCAQAAGLDEANLRAGARIGTVDDIGQVLMNADVIMDY